MEKQIMMKHIIENDVRPIMIKLFHRIKEGGLELTMDGVPAYNPKAQFVAGKVINNTCFTAIEFIKTEESLKTLGQIIRMVAPMEMETWGILNGIMGLYRLQTHGLLEKVVDEETLNLLKNAMDWRTFVDEENHYALIRKPTNYYGVAFGIARYRELLGWEPEGHSEHLLNRLIEHIDQFSGEFSFMDETAGEGRFDRYSILVPSEITALLIGTGRPVPEKIRTMLRNSCKIFLQLANEEGLGFSYGRSIGAYGDTAVLETFAAAAELGGILTEEETEIAYGYSMAIMKKMVEFWYDKDMDSINMWDHGRRTDSYRNKNRILGENLSLCMQVLNSYEHWRQAGFDNRQICDDFAEKLTKLDAYTYVPFAEGAYQRGLAIVRDGKQVWSLPLISGGLKYYDKDAYMHVPFQNLVLQGVPGYNHCQLTPQLIMENGEVYMPAVYTAKITPDIRKDSMVVTLEYDALCRMEHGVVITQKSLDDNPIQEPKSNVHGPQKAEGTKALVTYRFEKNKIHREDTIILESGEKVKEIRLVLLTYSEEPRIDGSEVAFGKGTITGMTAEGYDSCAVYAAVKDGSHDTPHGRLKHEVVWTRKVSDQSGAFKSNWTISYQ